MVMKIEFSQEQSIQRDSKEMLEDAMAEFTENEVGRYDGHQQLAFIHGCQVALSKNIPSGVWTTIEWTERQDGKVTNATGIYRNNEMVGTFLDHSVAQMVVNLLNKQEQTCQE